MYEVEINNKKVRIIDFYELDNMKTKKNLPREDFHVRLSENIEKSYEDFFINPDIEKLKEYLIKIQKMIDITYSFLLNKEIDMEEIYNEIKKNSLKLFLNNYEFNDNIEKICQNEEEIIENIKMYKTDKMNFVYYFLFSVFFFEKYQLEIVSLLQEELSDVKNMHELNSYLLEIFTDDFGEGFREFEMKTVGSLN